MSDLEIVGITIRWCYCCHGKPWQDFNIVHLWDSENRLLDDISLVKAILENLWPWGKLHDEGSICTKVDIEYLSNVIIYFIMNVYLFILVIINNNSDNIFCLFQLSRRETI